MIRFVLTACFSLAAISTTIADGIAVPQSFLNSYRKGVETLREKASGDKQIIEEVNKLAEIVNEMEKTAQIVWGVEKKRDVSLPKEFGTMTYREKLAWMKAEDRVSEDRCRKFTDNGHKAVELQEKLDRGMFAIFPRVGVKADTGEHFWVEADRLYRHWRWVYGRDATNNKKGEMSAIRKQMMAQMLPDEKLAFVTEREGEQSMLFFADDAQKMDVDLFPAAQAIMKAVKERDQQEFSWAREKFLKLIAKSRQATNYGIQEIAQIGLEAGLWVRAVEGCELRINQGKLQARIHPQFWEKSGVIGMEPMTKKFQTWYLKGDALETFHLLSLDGGTLTTMKVNLNGDLHLTAVDQHGKSYEFITKKK